MRSNPSNETEEDVFYRSGGVMCALAARVSACVENGGGSFRRVFADVKTRGVLFYDGLCRSYGAFVFEPLSSINMSPLTGLVNVTICQDKLERGELLNLSSHAQRLTSEAWRSKSNHYPALGRHKCRRMLNGLRKGLGIS